MIVDVEDYSPAWWAGVRSGFFLIEIGGAEFDAFEGRKAPIGTTVRIKGIHLTRGWLDTQLTLTAGPKPKRPLAKHPVECGRTVAGKEERPAWRRAIETHPEITDAEVRFAAFLADKCVYLDNKTREKDRWSIAKLAKALGMSRAKFVRARFRFLRRGFLDFVSGKESRTVTIYRLCWPKGQEPELTKKIIAFPSGMQQGSS
jgi:hypothetical protein